MKRTKKVGIYSFVFLFILITGCNQKQNMEKELKAFIKKYENSVFPLSKEANIAYFNATISGKKEDYDKAADLQIKLSKIYTDKNAFAQLEKFKKDGYIMDTLLVRELEMLHNTFRRNQIDEKKLEEIIKLGTEIENKFSNFRAEIDGKKLTDNEIEEVLSTSTNSEEVKKAWLASKKIGPIVADDVKKIVKMRNDAAHSLGFKNFHDMSLKLDQQDPEEIERLFNELDNLTRDAFAKEKDKMDDFFAKRFKISKDDLRPWHYQNRFFQEGPVIYPVDLDSYYKNKDIVKLTADYYKGIGLPMDQIMESSDLFEKEHKYQHAYCMDVDRSGDVRMVCNIKPNASWMGTMLHESGHAVYFKYMTMNLPYVLREPAHTFTTEAIAMLFGRFSSNPQWLKDVVKISDTEKEKIQDACFNTLRLEQLVFSRWVQVVYRFEKSMYANPDQDLNKLWWDLVEKYQMLKRPEGRNEPDWASKIHIATVPCYYHNYLLGELLASQLYFHITKEVVKSDDLKNQSFANNKKVGEYLKHKIFAPANVYHWNEMIEKATGEKLTPKYYAKQFVE